MARRRTCPFDQSGQRRTVLPLLAAARLASGQPGLPGPWTATGQGLHRSSTRHRGMVLPRAGRRAGCSEQEHPNTTVTARRHSSSWRARARCGQVDQCYLPALHTGHALSTADAGASSSLGRNVAGTRQQPARATATTCRERGALDGGDPLSPPVMGRASWSRDALGLGTPGVRRSVDRRGRVVRWLPARVSYRARGQRERRSKEEAKPPSTLRRTTLELVLGELGQAGGELAAGLLVACLHRIEAAGESEYGSQETLLKGCPGAFVVIVVHQGPRDSGVQSRPRS